MERTCTCCKEITDTQFLTRYTATYYGEDAQLRLNHVFICNDCKSKLPNEELYMESGWLFEKN